MRTPGIHFDWTGGLQNGAAGELVDFNDISGVAAAANGAANPFKYWMDFDYSGAVDFNDISIITSHLGHDCTHPNNP